MIPLLNFRFGIADNYPVTTTRNTHLGIEVDVDKLLKEKPGGKHMTATDAQVRIVMGERKKGKNQTQAAAKANLRSRQTVSKYERSGKLPSQMEKPRSYLTRKDAFEEDWRRHSKSDDKVVYKKGAAIALTFHYSRPICSNF